MKRKQILALLLSLTFIVGGGTTLGATVESNISGNTPWALETTSQNILAKVNEVINILTGVKTNTDKIPDIKTQTDKIGSIQTTLNTVKSSTDNISAIKTKVDSLGDMSSLDVLSTIDFIRTYGTSVNSVTVGYTTDFGDIGDYQSLYSKSYWDLNTAASVHMCAFKSNGGQYNIRAMYQVPPSTNSHWGEEIINTYAYVWYLVIWDASTGRCSVYDMFGNKSVLFKYTTPSGSFVTMFEIAQRENKPFTAYFL